MPHMVIFRNAEGRPGYHQADGLEDAVRFVEHLRNVEEVSETRVFSMQEVPLEFKSYWRVEVGPTKLTVVPVDDEGQPPVDDEGSVPDGVPVTPGGEMVGGGEPMPSASGRFGLFNRS